MKRATMVESCGQDDAAEFSVPLSLELDRSRRRQSTTDLDESRGALLLLGDNYYIACILSVKGKKCRDAAPPSYL